MTTNRLAPEELTRLRNAFARLAVQWIAAPAAAGAPAVFAPPFSSMAADDWRDAVRLWRVHQPSLLRELPARGCPGCGAADSRAVFQSYDGYPYHECLACGCWFVPLVVDTAVFDRLFERSPEARALAERMMKGRDDETRRAADMSRIGHYLDILRPMLRQSSAPRYLDVGCGVGHSLRAARDRDINAHGVEVDATARQLATADGLVVASDLGALGPGVFDLISFWETLEHITDPLAALQRVVPRLAPDGVVSLTVPNLNAPAVRVMREACAWVHGGYNTPGHINLFNGDVLTRLFERAGLRVFHVEGLYATGWHEVAAFITGSSRGAYDALGLGRDLRPGLAADFVDALSQVGPGMEIVERLAACSPIVWVTACRAERADAFATAAASRRSAQGAELTSAARALIATEPDYKAIAAELERHLIAVQQKYDRTLAGRFERWRGEGRFSFLRKITDTLGGGR